MTPIQRLLEQDERLVAGLMSGTSLDGIDVVIARLAGHGREIKIEQVAFITVPYPEELKQWLLRNSVPETSSVLELSQLNVRLAFEYAAAIKLALDRANLRMEDLALIGSHGQTVHHVPTPMQCAGQSVTSTLQIGDPSVLATITGVPVVGDFRLADMALGGQGAPLVPYFDWVYFAADGETRGLLNIGGISNITVLPGTASADDVLAFDTGPGNMLIDTLSRRFYGQPYDSHGEHAAKGVVHADLLASLLLDPYLVREPPKSTGREYFGEPFIQNMESMAAEKGLSLSPEDWMATATTFTAYSVYQAYARFIRPHTTLDVLIVSGGGKHNDFLMEKLSTSFSPIPVRTVDDYGLDSDAKEALCFAVLAHESASGIPTNIPKATGASRPTVLGKICLP
jgi:anhydro-N-acetylmuramic acid kinase